MSINKQTYFTIEYHNSNIQADTTMFYDANGNLIHQAVAFGYEYSTPLFYQNGYIVKVNNKAHKVLNL